MFWQRFLMRFGCCLNMVATGIDGTGKEYIEKLSELGFDYVEMPLAEMMALSENDFTKLKKCIEKAAICCEVCNNFFPKTMRLTGPDVDGASTMRYVENALERATQLGVKTVVFGSGYSKNVPEGFSLEEGYQQVVSLLKKINQIAKNKSIVIAIEPLRKAECNIINTFEEGCKLCKDVEGTNVKVLVDFYHLSEENEPVEHLLNQGREFLHHVHFANPEGRIYPENINESNYKPFISALKKIGYDGQISCEAYTKDFNENAPKALYFFKENLSF